VSGLFPSPLTVLQPQEIIAQSSQPTAKPDNAEAARQFEAMMMAYVFQQMRQTVPQSGLFGDDRVARSTYEYLFDQAVTTNALQAGKGWGLSERLEANWEAKATRNQHSM